VVVVVVVIVVFVVVVVVVTVVGDTSWQTRLHFEEVPPEAWLLK
jgi:hypothetical protein